MRPLTPYRHYVDMYQRVHKMRLKAKQHHDAELHAMCNDLLPHLKSCITRHLAAGLGLVPPSEVSRQSTLIEARTIA